METEITELRAMLKEITRRLDALEANVHPEPKRTIYRHLDGSEGYLPPGITGPDNRSAER